MRRSDRHPSNVLSKALSGHGFVLVDSARQSATSLATIVEPKDLSVVFQPIVDLPTQGWLFTHEVLARCSKPDFKDPTALVARVVTGNCCGRLGRMVREIAIPRCSGVPLATLVEATATAPDYVLAPRYIGARGGWKGTARHDTSEALAAR